MQGVSFIYLQTLEIVKGYCELSLGLVYSEKKTATPKEKHSKHTAKQTNLSFFMSSQAHELIQIWLTSQLNK